MSQLYINNVYSCFRLPDKMISDCGPQFDSQFWKELCNALQIRHAMSTAFHPQTNSGTEQVNREIQTYLSIFCINNPNSWAQALKKAEFVYNNRPHADRSQSPFELWYGLAPKAIPEAFEYHDYPKTEERLQQLTQWRNDALLAHEYTRQKMKAIIKVHYTPFDISQKVWLEGTNLTLSYNKKIKMKREGPFKVLEKLTPVTYRLELLKKWKMFPTFHAALLTPYKENDVHRPNFPHPPPDLIEGQEEWEIERIVRHKKQCGRQGTWQTEYQVKWKGYEDMTWEPE